MKRFALYLSTVLSFTAFTAGFAQSDTSVMAFGDFETNMFFFLRIADTDCPADFAGATCYVHGYTDFFDFADRFKALAVDQLSEVSRWRLTAPEAGADDGAPATFQATYRLRGDGATFTLIYAQNGLLVLTHDAER